MTDSATDEADGPSRLLGMPLSRAPLEACPHPSLLPRLNSAAPAPIGPERCATIIGTLQEMNTAPPDMGGCHRLIECVSKELRADSGVLMLCNPLTRRLEFVVHNQDPTVPKSYADYYCNLDPTAMPGYMRGAEPLPGGPRFHAVSDLRDVVDYGWLVSTEFYNDFFRSAGIHYDLVAFVATPATRAAIGLHRAHSSTPFSGEEVAILDMIAPFVGNHLERMTTELVLSALDGEADKGIILCDSRGRILYCNDSARMLWARFNQGDGASRLLDESSFIGYAVDNLEAIASQGDMELTFREVSLEQEDTGRLITLECRSNAAREYHNMLRERFGLSEREIEVLTRVVTGACNREIAQELFIAECTVKKHLQSISAKVGARTRTAIAHAVRQELGLTF